MEWSAMLAMATHTSIDFFFERQPWARTLRWAEVITRASRG
jgi:hypothetical protein